MLLHRGEDGEGVLTGLLFYILLMTEEAGDEVTALDDGVSLRGGEGVMIGDHGLDRHHVGGAEAVEFVHVAVGLYPELALHLGERDDLAVGELEGGFVLQDKTGEAEAL